jgi:hypothetical protein
MTAGNALGDGAYFGSAYHTSRGYSSANAVAPLPYAECAYADVLRAALDDAGVPAAPATPRVFLTPIVVAIARLDPGTEEDQNNGKGVVDHGWALVAKQEKLVKLRYLLVSRN